MGWRMPEKEWISDHKFKPYYVLGQLDMSKEVLIPRRRWKNGVAEDGFDVINPLYCYEGGKLSMQEAFADSDASIKVERAALIVKRGWVSARYRDKRSRPMETNTKKLVKVTGCYFAGKTIHDYKVPNDP